MSDVSAKTNSELKDADNLFSSDSKKSRDKANPAKSSYFKTEEEILEFWKTHKIFERSVSERSEAKQWNFLDGPPFVTGLPHYGHIIGSILKDVFPRFKTMQGYRVRRVWGWDGHGLPIENKVENALGVKSKREIAEKIGVKKFVEECKTYVKDVSGQWEWYIDHIGRWVNFKDAYKTWDAPYMESVMWVFKQMYEKGFIYKGLRVSLYCPHCATPISNFEVTMDGGENYKEVVEPANTYKYKLKATSSKFKEKESSSIPTYFLAWSTTPWTKLTTTALAVNPDLLYVTVELESERYIVAEAMLEQVFKAKGIDVAQLKVIDKKLGKELVGMNYEGHYDFYTKEEGKKLHVIVVDDFVTATEGTGIVTLAPYGEEDMKVMQRENIQVVTNIDEVGKLSPLNPPSWVGMYYLKVNPLVNEDLSARGLMFHEDSKHPHTVAHCWRCHERLFYNPQNAWFVDVQKLKPIMRQTNESVNWFPKHFKEGRFLKSMEAAPDWCISRSRYWGSPVPVWEHIHSDGSVERFVPGSREELEARSGVKVEDFHKPEIDNLVVPSLKDPSILMKRVPEVLDSWVEAGSASFAERHFPFDTTHKLESFFPPDFITEYTGQIRAWFYVLHVIAAAIYGRSAFKNVLVSGVIQGTDGRKMSKNYKNYPDPRVAIEQYGADALRLYLLGSPITKGEDINMSETDWRDQLRKFIIPLTNIYAFFEMYAKVDGYDISKVPTATHKSSFGNVLDKWLISMLHTCIAATTEALEAYDTASAVAHISQFVDDWSKWHVRRSRERVGVGAMDEHVQSFYETTHTVLEQFLRLIAPITPFHAEHLFQKISSEHNSVHLAQYPCVNETLRDSQLEEHMNAARKICEKGLQQRKMNNQKVRMPLRELIVTLPDQEVINLPNEVWTIVLDELNVRNITVNTTQFPKKRIDVTDDELAAEGQLRDLIRDIQAKRKDMGLSVHDTISVQIPRSFEASQQEISRKVRAREVTFGDTLEVRV